MSVVRTLKNGSRNFQTIFEESQYTDIFKSYHLCYLDRIKKQKKLKAKIHKNYKHLK